MGSRDRSVKDPDGMLATVAQCIEHLRQNSSTLQEKEFLLIQLSDLVAQENALTAIGSHSQVVPVLVSLLRAGSFQVKIQAANVLGSLCKENDLRVKVLLGGCIPPLLSLLKSASTEAQLAAATTIHAVSYGGSKDHIGSKIFSTEGVIPVLWKLLENGPKSGNPVDDLLTGALRNLSYYTDGFYHTTADSRGVDVLINLLKNGGPGTKADACHLISHMMTADASICDRILKADVTKELVALVGPGHEASVRAEAAAALKSLSQNCKNAKFEITNCGGIPALINATIAPSKEFMKGEYAYALQENTISALANIFGGLTHVISSLSKSLGSDLTPVQCADTLGALASALMIYDSRMDEMRASDPCFIERVLVGLLEPGPEFVVRERTIEALASLYGNDILSSRLIDPVAKRLLVCLVTTTSGEVHDDLMKTLLLLCNNEDGGRLWRAVGGREGVQLLISFLGLATEEQQECVVSLLCLLSEENDESKWAVTAAGGIPPLVQILESGSAKAREDSAMILGNLSDHSEDIRACVESADCVPALLWLLKNGTTSGKGTAAKTLNRVIRRSDTSAVGQLTALLTADVPESKVFVLESLNSMLSVASLRDLVEEGSAANDAVETMVKCLSSANVETQAVSAASLSAIFQGRRDLRESTVGGKTFWYIMKLVDSCENETVLVELVRCLASIFLSVGTDREVAAFSKEALPSLLSLVNSSGLDVMEQAVCAISNILLDSEVAERVVAEEILFPATRVLVEGSDRGKALAATTIARLLGSRCVDRALAGCVNGAGTVPALVSYLECGHEGGVAIAESLDALSLLVWCREEEENCGKVKPVWSVHFPKGITPVVYCIPMVEPVLQDKAIEILSRLCRDGSDIIGEAVCGSPGIGSSIARRVVDSVKMNVKIGGCVLLISGGKVDPHLVVEELSESYLCVDLVRALVSMLDHTRSFIVHGVVEVDDDEEISICRLRNEEVVEEEMGRTAVIYGTDAAAWLLSLIACFDKKSMVTIMEAGAIEIINERISQCSYKFLQVDFREDNSLWVFLLLLAILFQDIEISDSQETVKSIPLLANILKSDDITSRYFAAQAISSLVRNGNNQTLISAANFGVATGLISLLGCAHDDIHDLIELANDFTLFHFPEIEALEGLFRVEGIGDGPASQKAIPALVDLLKPIPDRPGAPILALGLLTLLAHNTPSNSAVMVESGVLEALTRYLSLGPQDTPEEAATDLLGTLFATAEIRCHESAPAAVTQLVAVLRLGGRSARYSAARALERLFSSVHIRNADNSLQAVHPLVETLNTGSEREQQAAIGALVKLLTHNSSSKAHIDPDAELTMVDALYRILSSDCLVEVKGEAAELCGVLFGSSRVRSTMGAARCVEPLLSLLLTDGTPPSAQLSVVHALDRLLDDDQLAELVAAHGSVVPLVGLLYGKEDELHEAVCRTLVKLGKDRPFCKLEMVKSGVIENVLEIITEAPFYLSTALAELLRILTNNVTIARGPSAAKVVEPLFILLSRAELGQECRHSTLQVLVNILEHRMYNSEYTLTAKQAVDSLIPLLDVPITAIQKLVVELLSHLLQDESVRNDPIITHVIGPLTRVIGSGADVLQQGAVKALVSVAGTWPNEIAKEGGVNQLSKVILQTDPSMPLWESAASVLASILQFSSDYFLEVPVAVLVRLLRSTLEPTIVASLNTLLVLESDDGTSGEAMAESGAIDALLELLKCHQCEESAARLLEVLLNNVKIREAKETKSAILPLSQYLLDPLTLSVQARLLASLALGDLFQNEGFSRTGDAQSACRALVNVLEDQPTEELKVVAICALQNLVMYSRSNKRAVAEAGGVQVLLDLIGSSEPETSVQASIFIKLLFSNHTIQEYASSETVRALTAAIEKELWATGGVNEEYLKALNALFNNFTRLRATEPATLTIPHLVASLKTPVEATQEAALDTLFLLRQAWSSCPAEISRAQSVAAADAIPLLQYLIQSGPPRFQEKAEFLLQCLPGTLVVIIKRGNNMKQSVGSPSLYCKLMLANTPPKQTKILSTGPNPEWDESFSWSFECPPKGQKLQIACKNKSKMGKSSFGKVTIQIDRVVMLGCVSGEYALVPESKSGSSRNLEIEFQWSNT